MISKILRKNTSAGRIVGFVLSNFIGLAIVLGALQFYGDAASIWSADDSFIKSDYLVLNRKVTSESTMTGEVPSFSEADISQLERQPWVRRVGRFTAANYRVSASIGGIGGKRGMSTQMFFEAIPDSFVDVPRSKWLYRPDSGEVPIILPKDYLGLYNFGFAASAGLPQLSEGMIGSIPVTLRLTSDEDTTRHMRRRGTRVLPRELILQGRVAGFSNRLNTILVPEQFMAESNRRLGRGAAAAPRRVIVDVNSPGDVAIGEYLESHGLEVAGDKSASSSAYLLKVVTGIVIGVGVLITLLSLFILVLSVSLILEKNRDKLHSLLMLGYPEGEIARPYELLVSVASVVAMGLAVGAVFVLRGYYLEPLRGLGATPSGVWPMLVAGVLLTALIIIVNVVYIRRKVRGAFRRHA